MKKFKTLFSVAASAALMVTAYAPGAAMAANNQSGSSNGISPQKVQNTISQMKRKDPNLQKLINNSYAYVVFPTVGKGGAIVGGAYGHGEAYQHGHHVGNATITKFDIGAQLGGQSFSEAIFFKNPQTFKRFKQGNYQFSDDASAVAIKSGATSANNYSNGVAIFTMANGGLMAGVSVGGQKFSYTAVSSAPSSSQ